MKITSKHTCSKHKTVISIILVHQRLSQIFFFLYVHQVFIFTKKKYSLTTHFSVHLKVPLNSQNELKKLLHLKCFIAI